MGRAGHRVFDLPASLWYCNVGHGRAEIADAAAAQMRKIEAYSNFQQYATRPGLELAERLADLAPVPDPEGLPRLRRRRRGRFAAKLARRYWDAAAARRSASWSRRERSYHGLHGFGTSIARPRAERDGYGAAGPDVSGCPPTTGARSSARGRGRRGHDRRLLLRAGHRHRRRDPRAGLPPDVQRICRENEIIFVVDEVISGFGRTGELFASERFGIEPDVLALREGHHLGLLPLGGAIVADGSRRRSGMTAASWCSATG